MKFKQSFLRYSLPILVWTLAVVGIIYAWTEPTAGPATPNVSAPVNISGAGQTKAYVNVSNKGWLGIAADNYDSNYGLTVGYLSNKLGIKVRGNSYFQGATSDSAGAALSIVNDAATSILYVRNDGNVGIGTTAPESGLHLYGDKYITFGPNSTWGARLQVGGNGRVTTYASVVATNGNLHIDAQNGGYGTYINYYSQNNTIINGQGGNVGIGTTNPGQKLEVVGTIKSGTTPNPTWGNLIVGTANTNTVYAYGSMCVGNSSGTCDGTGGVVILGTGVKFPDGTTQTTAAGAGSSLWASSGANISNTNTGNVGIGTAAPGYKLDVSGDIRGTGTLYISTGNSTGGGIKLADDGDIVDLNDGWATHRFSYGLRLTNANAGGSTVIQLANGNSGSTYFNSGNVGIGTAAPNQKFDIGNGSDGITMAPAINLDNNFTVQTYIDGQYANRVAYAGGCCNNLVLQPDVGTVSIGGVSGNYGANKFNVIGQSYFSGNVGIGTTNPGQKLDVLGNIKVGQADHTSILLRDDESPNGIKYIHANSNVVGFLSGGGSWINYTNESGQVWTPNYGWLHDKFRSFNTWQNSHYSGTGGEEYATIFYDTNNAGYYVNPDGGSNLSGVTINNRLTVSEAGGAYTFITLRDDESPNGVKYIHANSNVIGFLNGAAGWIAYWGNAGNMENFGPITADAYYCRSDITLKENLQKLDNPLGKIMSLEGLSFTWKADGKPGIGFTAQDVEHVFPELVSTDAKTGLKSVQYDGLFAPLVEAIKEQQKEIDELNAKIDKLMER